MDGNAFNRVLLLDNKPFVERRRVRRAALEPLATVTLQGETSSNEYLCTLCNISPLGIMAEVLCGEDFALVPPDEEMKVASCDESLQDLMQNRQLALIWHEEGRAGFLFEPALPVENEQLRQRLEDQRLLPWDTWRF